MKFSYDDCCVLKDDIEATIQSLRHTSETAKKYESYRLWIPFGLSGKSVLTECKGLNLI